MNHAASTTLDLEHLLRLRLVVARFGEMDVSRWWNTNGMLGALGPKVLSRGFPRTHLFAQARVVFAVARARCNEVFNPPGCMTLWSLPAAVEDRFEESWPDWTRKAGDWEKFFTDVATIKACDLLDLLQAFELLNIPLSEEARKLRRSAEGRSVPLFGTHVPDNDTCSLLAAGFFRGEPGKLAVPYARLEA